ncbi:mitochondrial ribosomal protein subunit l31 [Grosmannia clavigera kw1407]|uniref:Mitochondrial ribosomal protein subunit l31 n=1 Tax=Grosmannia clavigera (strain kw1407 / UAMH 11150) TaxID=655863 RepID=F0XGY2_GROCL|nr:mitochondrial ribosomal protein subunit l31 [Grosmannia clavigera kw1407]EFX02842.1 mitochondrial ribosomal protein subunit l31 [Grosmannia clavigera kw1407]
MRLRAVDSVISTVDKALEKQGTTLKALELWKAQMPTEKEMLPRDKYTLFDRKAKRYRKSIHKLPKWTRVSQRINPPGY